MGFSPLQGLWCLSWTVNSTWSDQPLDQWLLRRGMMRKTTPWPFFSSASFRAWGPEMPGKAVPERKHGLPNVCFSPNLVNCKQDFGGWIPRSFFFTTSGCGDVGSCFFVLHPAYSSSRRPAPSSPLFQLSLSTDSISIDFSIHLSLSHSSPSTSRSINLFFCIHLYQLLSLSLSICL